VPSHLAASAPADRAAGPAATPPAEAAPRVQRLRADQVFNVFATSPRGLSSDAAGALREQYGPNELPRPRRKVVRRRFLAQFTDLFALVPGRLRRRRHGARRPHGHRGRGPRQEGGPAHRRVPARGVLRARAPAPPADCDRLNTWNYSDAPASVRPQLALARRVSTFDEVKQGLDESTALFEARRCMSCGNCFECDNCYGVCPDNAITKLGPGKGFEIDLDYCKGCGLCAAECPSGAIDMVPEE
jgi:2-oxoacid:acceptor oxidoreductase delta subunit (pyruvate/2-ketoisovalerate family)